MTWLICHWCFYQSHFRRSCIFLTTRRNRASSMALHSPSATTIVFQSSVILLLWCVLVSAYHDYCIVGAGPSGLQMGYFFQRAARDYVIYEKSNVSGTIYFYIMPHICDGYHVFTLSVWVSMIRRDRPSLSRIRPLSHRIGGNLKLLRESTNMDRKWLKQYFPLQIVVLDCQFEI